jgi:hypothetical protein
MFQINPTERPTISEIFAFPWMNKAQPKIEEINEYLNQKNQEYQEWIETSTQAQSQETFVVSHMQGPNRAVYKDLYQGSSGKQLDKLPQPAKTGGTMFF